MARKTRLTIFSSRLRTMSGLQIETKHLVVVRFDEKLHPERNDEG